MRLQRVGQDWTTFTSLHILKLDWIPLHHMSFCSALILCKPCREWPESMFLPYNEHKMSFLLTFRVTMWLTDFHGHEFEQTLGGGGGQGSLVCCGPRGHSRMRLSDWNSNCKMGKWYFLAQNGSARRQTRRKSHAFSERQIGFVPKCGHCPVSDSMCCSPGMETLDSESKTTGPVVLSLWWVQSRASSSKSTSPSP